ncbi:hypothetical protein MHBO_004645, partial [Bonamia ostreae]
HLRLSQIRLKSQFSFLQKIQKFVQKRERSLRICGSRRIRNLKRRKISNFKNNSKKSVDSIFEQIGFSQKRTKRTSNFYFLRQRINVARLEELYVANKVSNQRH